MIRAKKFKKKIDVRMRMGGRAARKSSDACPSAGNSHRLFFGDMPACRSSSPAGVPPVVWSAGILTEAGSPPERPCEAQLSLGIVQTRILLVFDLGHLTREQRTDIVRQFP